MLFGWVLLLRAFAGVATGRSVVFSKVYAFRALFAVVVALIAAADLFKRVDVLFLQTQVLLAS